MEEMQPTISMKGLAGPRPVRRRLVWIGLGFGLLLLAFSAWVAWQARGLEARVVEAVRPLLASDVAIGEVSLSFWSAWPDVEVVLDDVRIEDALQRGQDFLALDEIGFRMACLPLLANQLEVRSLRLQGGKVSLKRTKSGEENWQFWHRSDTGSDGPEGWKVEGIEVLDVEVVGEWNGTDERVAWSGLVVASDLALVSEDGSLSARGHLEADGVDLQTGSDQWLEDRAVRCDLDLRAAGDRVDLVVADGHIGGEDWDVELAGVMASAPGDFRIALSSDRFAIGAAESTLPPGVYRVLKPTLSGLGGAVQVELSVGGPVGLGHWGGPNVSEWDGGWALRLGERGTTWTDGLNRARWTSGVVEVFSKPTGWKALGRSVGVGVAGGEFQGGVEVEQGRDAMRVEVDGRGVFRPNGIWAWSGYPSVDSWKEWAVGAEGQVELRGGVKLLIREGQGIKWDVAPGTNAALSGLSVVKAGQAIFLETAEGEVVEGGQWNVQLGGVSLPGLAGRAQASWANGAGRMIVDLVQLDVDALLSLVDDVKGGAGMRGGALAGPWSLEVSCGPVSHGPLDFERLSLAGTWTDGALDVGALEAVGLDGRVEATGRVDMTAASFDGRLVDADFAQVLEGTSGMGQDILLARHVRGRVWAEGKVSHVFGRTESAPWDADVQLRLEQAELIGFELLQEIPDVLESERKYRLISDAQDLRRRLNRVRFDPLDVRLQLESGMITLDPVEIGSDALDLGVKGWYRMGGPMDFTLDFALRDLKSEGGEFGRMEEDGLGHRFFLAMRGTLENPEFGYDRNAHQSHRKEGRQGAWGRLRDAFQGELNRGRENSTELRAISPDSAGVGTVIPPVQTIDIPIVAEDDDDDF